MESTLKITRSDADSDQYMESDGPLRLERRQVDRWPMQGIATGFCISGEAFGQMHDLRMLDFSDRGLGAISDQPIDPGTTLSIGFQSPGYCAKCGVVQRCTPCGEGYRVAIRFEWRMAA